MSKPFKLPRAKPMVVFAGIKAGATYPDGTRVADVAKIQEYGAPDQNIPPRPFLHQAWVDIARWDLPGLFNAGGPELVGKLAAEAIQKTIMEWTDPRNADATIAKKGTDSPLRDTMLMTRSVTWWTPDMGGEDGQ